MLDDSELTTFAKGMAAALRVLEPATHDQVAGMLCALGLTQEEARAVIAHGLARGIFVDGDEHIFAAVPSTAPKSGRRRARRRPVSPVTTSGARDEEALLLRFRAAMEEARVLRVASKEMVKQTSALTRSCGLSSGVVRAQAARALSAVPATPGSAAPSQGSMALGRAKR